MAEFFGFEINRKGKDKEVPKVSFVPNTDEDGAGGVMVVAYTLSGNVVFEAIFVGRNGSHSERLVLDE